MRHSTLATLLPHVVLSVGLTGQLPAQGEVSFGHCAAARTTVSWGGPRVRSFYVALEDGTRIALDAVLPEQLPAGTRIPTVFVPTRYWRSAEGQPPRSEAARWIAHGYAVVTMDVRGTGASFGTWKYPYSSQESRDVAEIVSWIAKQPWSNGKIVSFGISYTANTAEMVALSNHPAVKAIVPRSSDFDMFDDLVFPGGIANFTVIDVWGDGIYGLDHNLSRRTADGVGVRPVDADRDKSVLAEAVSSHAMNPRLSDGMRNIVFRDDRPPQWGASFDDFASYSDRPEMERSKVPIYAWAGWQDAGVAYGSLKRFTSFTNLQRLVIGPWNHGINMHTDQFLPRETAVIPDVETQYADILCFFDQFVNGNDNGFGQKLVVYYTQNEAKWKTTRQWPVPGAARTRWYFGPDHSLTSAPPAAAAGNDPYQVDFEHTTGKQNRWWTQVGGGDPKYVGDVFYPDRAAAGRRLLTYTSTPLDRDIEVTGHPTVSIHLAATATDGAIFVYLEAVDPAGQATYITEGEIRFMHRKVSADPAPHQVQVPYHSLKRKDALPVVPAEVMEISLGLLPTSVLLRRGHRLRIAIAGADKDTFVRLPAEGPAVLTVERNSRYPSYLEMPVFERR